MKSEQIYGFDQGGGAHRRLLPLTLLVCGTLLLTGCSTTGEVDPNSLGGTLETLTAFVQDFARQALAAWLL